MDRTLMQSLVWINLNVIAYRFWIGLHLVSPECRWTNVHDLQCLVSFKGLFVSKTSTFRTGIQILLPFVILII